MRRFFIGGGLVLFAGFAAFMFSRGTSDAVPGGRVVRGTRYGGRTWRAPPASSCTAVVGEVFPDDWTDISPNTGPQTITLLDAVSPDCTTDATRVQFPAAPGNYNTLWSPASPAVCTTATGAVADPFIWVRGRSAGGTIGVCMATQLGAYDCMSCAFTTAWKLCTWTTLTTMSVGGNSGRLIVGNTGILPTDGPGAAGGPTAAIDVELWGWGCTP